MLGKDFPEATRLSSHSLKATGLSWAASGVPLDTRRLLAHHVHDGARSTETYSRDVLAPAARVFEEALLAIGAGDFAPDNPQFAGKNNTLRLSAEPPVVEEDVFLRPRKPAAQEWPLADEPDVPEAKAHLSDTDNSASERESEDDMPLDPPLPQHRERRPAVASLPSWCTSWMHVTSGCLHVAGGPHHKERLLCGRKLSDRYFRSDVQELDEGRPHCKQCWSHTSLED